MIALLLPCSFASPRTTPPDPTELVRVDTRGTAASIDALAERVASLDDEPRREAALSLQVLAISDPYVRAAIQLALVLQVTTEPVPAEVFAPWVQSDWLALRHGVDQHVQLLHALGATLASTGPHDPLHAPGAQRLPDEATLLASRDPIALTQDTLERIPAFARTIDAPLRQRLDEHNDRVEALTGIMRPCPRGPWAELPGQSFTLGLHLAGWHDALRRVEPFVEDDEVQEQVRRLIGLLDTWGTVSAP